MIYFVAPWTKENIEVRYKQLAKIFHPDKGGTEEEMKRLNYEYEKAKEIIKKGVPAPKKKFARKMRMKKRASVVKNIFVVREVNIKEALDGLKMFNEFIKQWKS